MYNFIHLNLAVALLLALIVFVSGIELASDISVSLYIINIYYVIVGTHFTVITCCNVARRQVNKG